MRGYSIVIPSCTASNLQPCLDALQLQQPGGLLRVMVYDTDDTGGVEQVCEDYRVHRIIGYRPFIFSQAFNVCSWLCSKDDIILLNDDALLVTWNGFDKLHAASDTWQIVSSSVKGTVGGAEQEYRPGNGEGVRRVSHHTVVFICVHIARTLINEIGLMDDRLTGYGYDDDLYCLQTRAAGYLLGVYDKCIVEHGTLPSTYRKPDRMPSLEPNQRIFEKIVKEKVLEKYWPVPFRYSL